MLKDNAQILDRRRLGEAWYKRAYISIIQRYRIKEDIEYLPSEQIDERIEESLDVLWRQFTREWSSNFHTDKCHNKSSYTVNFGLTSQNIMSSATMKQNGLIFTDISLIIWKFSQII